MVYFDNAATSYPKPQSVLFAVNDAVKIYGGNPGRSGHKVSMRVSEKIFEVRKKLSDFFNTSPERVIFTLNCTHALNMAIKGVMAKGGHIVTSSLEHNSVLRPIYKMALDGKITYSVAKVSEDKEKTLKAFKNMVTPDTKAIVCTFASNVSGTLLPIKELSVFCRERGIIFIVDAAQGAGMFKIDMKDIDILCTAGHKGLYGTTGTGLLICGGDFDIDTIIEGGTGSNSLELIHPDFLPDRFESGTLNTVGILSLGAGLDVITKKGVENIYLYEMALCMRVYNELKRMKNISLVAESFKLYEKAPIVSFNIKDIDSSRVSGLLSERGYMLRGGFHCAPLAHKQFGTDDTGAVRFSPSHFNTTKQVNAFLYEVQKIAE